MAALELDCKIINKLAPQKGVGARGPWIKQEFVVEYQDGQYPEKALLLAWGADRVKDLDNYQPGDHIKASLKLQARERNGRWFNDVRVWRIVRVQDSQDDSYTSSFSTYAPATGNRGAADMPQEIGASTGFGVHEGQEAPADIPAPASEDFSANDLPF